MLVSAYNFWSEWEANEKVSFDGVNKLIVVYPHVTALDVRADVWSASVRWLAILQRGNDRFDEPMERTGLDPIPGGETGDSYFLQNGWRLVVDFSKVKVTGVLFSRDFESAYYTSELLIQFAAQVASVVNTVSTTTNVVTGTALTANETADAVWSAVTRTLTENLGLDEASLHNSLDTYLNKDTWKADVSNLSADVNVVEVAGVAVTGVDDFKADVSNLSADVNVVEVAGVAVTGVEDFKVAPTDLTGVLNAIAALQDLSLIEVTVLTDAIETLVSSEAIKTRNTVLVN